tara:strand:+ start:42 stop:665 length:624 start_codon:yes stop_codon:yes gene_type:complete
MAIISSYPISVPQFADQVLGTNTYDATGTPVNGNPTVQYTLSSVKTLVDQQFIQKIYSANPALITPPLNATGAILIFGATDITTPDVTYTAATGKVTFAATGTYYIQQKFLLSATAANRPLFGFKTMQDSTTQVGPTSIQSYVSQASLDRLSYNIEQMVNITSASTFYHFWAISDLQGAQGLLQPQLLNGNWGTAVPSASLTISKLI